MPNTQWWMWNTRERERCWMAWRWNNNDINRCKPQPFRWTYSIPLPGQRLSWNSVDWFNKFSFLSILNIKFHQKKNKINSVRTGIAVQSRLNASQRDSTTIPMTVYVAPIAAHAICIGRSQSAVKMIHSTTWGYRIAWVRSAPQYGRTKFYRFQYPSVFRMETSMGLGCALCACTLFKFRLSIMNWFFNYSQFLSISFDFIHSTSTRKHTPPVAPASDAEHFPPMKPHNFPIVFSFTKTIGCFPLVSLSTMAQPQRGDRELRRGREYTITMFFNHLTYTYTSKCCIRSPIWEIDFNFILIFFLLLLLLLFYVNALIISLHRGKCSS